MKKNKVKIPNCWICKDDGLVIYSKRIKELSYEFGSRCRCYASSNYGSGIPTIDEQFAEAIAEDNLRDFMRSNPGVDVFEGRPV